MSATKFFTIIVLVMICVLGPILIYANTAMVEYQVSRPYDDEFIDGYFVMNVPSIWVFGNKEKIVSIPKYTVSNEEKVKKLSVKRRVWLPFKAEIISAHSVSGRVLSIWVEEVREDFITQVLITPDIPFNIEYFYKKIKVRVDSVTAYSNRIYKKNLGQLYQRRITEEMFLLKTIINNNEKTPPL